MRSSLRLADVVGARREDRKLATGVGGRCIGTAMILRTAHRPDQVESLRQQSFCGVRCGGVTLLSFLRCEGRIEEVAESLIG